VQCIETCGKVQSVKMTRKKKIYVEDFLKNIKSSQDVALDSLKIYASKLKKIAEEIELKIERDGASSYYSTHHESKQVVDKIYITSLRLGELKKLEEDLKSFNKKNK
jgi:hypothetical protein